MKKNKFNLSLLLIIILFCFIALPVLAIELDGNEPPFNSNQTVELENPLGNVTNPLQLYSRLIFSFMGITGVLAMVMFIVGGLQWMTASGNADKVKKGRDTLMWAVLGLIVIFSSYAIIRTILETLNF